MKDTFLKASLGIAALCVTLGLVYIGVNYPKQTWFTAILAALSVLYYNLGCLILYWMRQFRRNK